MTGKIVHSNKFLMAAVLISIVCCLELATCDNFGARDYTGPLIRIDRELQEAGMSSSSSNDHINRILSEILSKSPGDKPTKYLLRMGRILRGDRRATCTDGRSSYISIFDRVVENHPSELSEPLKRFIQDASSKANEFCLETLSATNWRLFEHQLKVLRVQQFADLVEQSLGGALDKPDELADESSELLLERVNSVAKSRRLYPVDVFRAMKVVAVETSSMFESLGPAVPVDRMNDRVRSLYCAGLIWSKLSEDKAAIVRRADSSALSVSVLQRLAYIRQSCGSMAEAVARYASERQLPKEEIARQLGTSCDLTGAQALALLDSGVHISFGRSDDAQTALAKVCLEAKRSRIIK